MRLDDRTDVETDQSRSIPIHVEIWDLSNIGQHIKAVVSVGCESKAIIFL